MNKIETDVRFRNVRFRNATDEEIGKNHQCTNCDHYKQWALICKILDSMVNKFCICDEFKEIKQ